MSDTKQVEHTPGPWKSGGCVVWESDGDLICDLISFGSKRDNDTIEANARLIAAAPDMLAALKVARLEFADMAETAGDDDHFNEGGSAYEAIQLIKAAIAKGGA